MATEVDTNPADGAERAATTGSEREQESTRSEREQESSSQSSDSELEAVKAKLAEANREAAKHRRERDQYKADLDKRQADELSELERERKRADDTETRLAAQQEKVRTANLKVALSEHKSNIIDVDTASLLLRSRGLEFDDEGEPQDFDKAVTTLVKDKPWLTGKGKPASRGGTNAGAGSEDESGTAGLTADELAMARSFGMTAEDYAKNKNVRTG